MYDAAGNKLKQVTDSSGRLSSRYYYGAFEYGSTMALSLIHMEEGVVTKETGGYTYEYFLKDHLGNVRMVFKPGATGPIVLQKTDYFPFGMAFPNQVNSSSDNKYLYNGKEIQSSLDLGWYDYGARFYDPQIGRWTTPDQKAEKFISWSSYNYCYDNPINYIDPDGKENQEADKKKTYKKESKTYTYTYNGDNSHSVSQSTTTTSYSYNTESGKWDETTTSQTNTVTFSSKDGTFTESGGESKTSVSSTEGNLSLYKDDKGNSSTVFNATGKTSTTSSSSEFSSDNVSLMDKGHFQDAISGVKNWLSDNGMKSTPLVEAYKKYQAEITGIGYGISLGKLLSSGGSKVFGWAGLASTVIYNSANAYHSKAENLAGESITLIPVKKKE